MQANFIENIPLDTKDLSLNIFRLDLLHAEIDGNKYFKLLYNLEYAKDSKLPIVTLGGAHSNHIYSSAKACKNEGIDCYGIIRGENFTHLSSTLQHAKNFGMKLIFVDRTSFRILRELSNNVSIFRDFLSTKHIYLPKDFHLIPEGGSNKLGLLGAKEILNNLNVEFDLVVSPVGTGGTLAGLINFLAGSKKVIGISALKDEYLSNQVSNLLEAPYKNWEINFDFSFGGYAKWKPELINFINNFKKQTGIPLCPIYTGKMLYGISELMKQGHFSKDCKILCLHTGGLQSIEGFNMANGNIIL